MMIDELMVAGFASALPRRPELASKINELVRAVNRAGYQSERHGGNEVLVIYEIEFTTKRGKFEERRFTQQVIAHEDDSFDAVEAIARASIANRELCSIQFRSINRREGDVVLTSTVYDQWPPRPPDISL